MERLRLELMQAREERDHWKRLCKEAERRERQVRRVYEPDDRELGEPVG